MLPRMNKMLPTFRKSSLDCSLMILASMHSMLSLQSRNNLYKKNQKLEHIFYSTQLFLNLVLEIVKNYAVRS